MRNKKKREAWWYFRLTPEQLEEWLDSIEPQQVTPFLRVLARMMQYRPPLKHPESAWRRIADLRTVPEWRAFLDMILGTGHLTLGSDSSLSCPWAEAEWRFRDKQSAQNARNGKMRGKKQKKINARRQRALGERSAKLKRALGERSAN
jgi:hypothetical protein